MTADSPTVLQHDDDRVISVLVADDEEGMRQGVRRALSGFKLELDGYPGKTTFAVELAADGIKVNSICPRQIQTEMGTWGWNMKAFAHGQSLEEYIEDMKKEIPAGRPGTPEDCANVVSWLRSTEAEFITGQAINVTGGQLMEL